MKFFYKRYKYFDLANQTFGLGSLVPVPLDFNNGSWLKFRVSAVPSATPPPAGYTDPVIKVIEDTTNSTHHPYFYTPKSTIQIQYTAEWVLKSAGRTRGWFFLFSDFGSQIVWGNFNLGTVTNVINRIGTGWSNYTGGIITLGGGWFRLWITATSDNLAVVGFNLYLANATGGVTYLGDGVSGFEIASAKLYTGPLV